MQKRKLTYTQIIALGFLGIILLGAFLLCLPVSSQTKNWTPFMDSLLTATSSTCVTGLSVYDTGTYWSTFGHVVILTLIQIGGLGFMTVITMFSMLMKRQIGMRERKILMQSAGNLQLSGMIRLVKKILFGTFLFEGAGAVVLSCVFVPRMGTKGIWFGIFHSVSAFCNAGFDLMGQYGETSFSGYVTHPVVNITLMVLIVIGGIGFLVWSDILKCRFRPKKFDLHTKIVLTVTGILLVGGAVLFYFTERNAAFRDLSSGESILAAAFQSVTTRTAGFLTVPQKNLSSSGSLLSMVLMLIGGSPGSTAGGMKTTTIAVLLLSTIANARNCDSVVVFKRRIADDIVKQAGAIVTIYLCATVLAAGILCALEPIGLRESLYEITSAVGTVGLSMEVTPTLGGVSKGIVTFLMYAGRLGGMSLMMALAEKRTKVPLERPIEKILIG